MIDFITENWEKIVSVITAVVTAAAAITAVTPTPKDDNVVMKIRKFLDLLGLNIAHAKNAEEQKNK